MTARRITAGIGLAAFIAAGIAVPALGAAAVNAARHGASAPTLRAVEGLMGFTPASADPKLAAFLARSGVDAASFRFTPAQSHRLVGDLSVTMHGRDSRVADQAPRLPRSAGGPAVAPIAYSIGGTVDWKGLSIGGDLGHVDLAGMPGSRDSHDVTVGFVHKRLSGRVKAESDRPTAGAAPVDDLRSYTVDVGGSYALTHNLAVTAGVRYRSERTERLEAADPTRESHAVYVGTAFRF